MIVGAFFSTPEHPVSDMSDILIGAPSEGVDGRALALTQVVRQCIGAAPWQMDDRIIRASLAVLGTDGQYAAGERSRHTPVDVSGPIFSRWENASRALGPFSQIGPRRQQCHSRFRPSHRGHEVAP